MNLAKVFKTIDTHVLGEAFRIATQFPAMFTSLDVKENESYLKEHFHTEKNLILNEPRGHRGINGCIILPSVKADYQLQQFNHETMNHFKYESLFASLTALLETGNMHLSEDGKYRIETVEGIFELEATYSDDEVTSISLSGISAEILEEDDGFYKVSVDGRRNYYIYSLPESIDAIQIKHLADLTAWGSEKINSLIQQNNTFEGVIIKEAISERENRFRTVTFERDGYIRRSPSIDSSVALFATLKNNNDRTLYNETIFGSSLTTELTEDNKRYAATLRPFITGTHEFVYDKEDPLTEGFILK